MKRTFMLFLALALTAMLCLSACGGSDSSGYNGNPYDSNVIYKANESAAMQQAHNALTCALVMSNTGTVPSGTMIVLDYDNSADTLPDYGFLYNGNTLERCDLNTAAFAEMNTIIISPDLIPQYKVSPMLENILRAATGIYGGEIGVEDFGNGELIAGIGTEESFRLFNCYTSVDFSNNVAVFLISSHDPYEIIYAETIPRANESAAMQQAKTALMCALMMSSNATLPDGTMFVVDSDKSAETPPDYGFLYNGNTLERCDLNTAAFAEMDTLIVSPDLIPQYSSADPMLENVLRAVTGIYNGAITVQNNGGSVKITIGSRAFDCYYSSEFSKNVAVFLNLNPND